MPNLDLIGLPGQVPPEQLAARLTNRAIYFHEVIRRFSGQNQSSIPVGLSVVPTEACIGPRSDDRSRPKNLNSKKLQQKEKRERKAEKEKAKKGKQGTSESISRSSASA